MSTDYRPPKLGEKPKPKPVVTPAQHQVLKDQPMPPAVAKLGYKGPGGKKPGGTGKNVTAAKHEPLRARNG
jgi:hypothetical protein